MNILVLNGPNLNMLGTRQPDVYGSTTYGELVLYIQKAAQAAGVSVKIQQSNHEGVLVEAIQQAKGQFDGIVLNAGAYTHTSIAILDALLAVELPAAEVHITDIAKREDFRQINYAGRACALHYIGQGIEGYKNAIEGLARYIEQK